ncbi:MAG TPA: M50 family metallopeptidase [Labilithrix sp.]|nr:M50 family metallopeptidase [Labilithrix sp.]
MSVASALIAILGLAVLMVVHESGHYFAARRFGMRVTKFSIGFGPTLWKHRPKGSPTTFQIAIIPFLAYVQIAGLNPYEEIDPKDPESYANASLWARIVTIVAGPLSNYLFASVLFFFGFWFGGYDVDDMRVEVLANGPAAQASMQSGDRILSIDGVPIHPDASKGWEQLQQVVGTHPNQKIDVEVERRGERLHVFPTPQLDGDKGRIQVRKYVAPVSAKEAGVLSITEPAETVYRTMTGLARIVTGKEKAQLSGPVGIVRDTAAAARSGAPMYLKWLGVLSAYLGAFNLLPIPALDGGRLLFLLFEATSRRRADAKVEAVVHAIGLLMFVTLIAFVTLRNDLGLGR